MRRHAKAFPGHACSPAVAGGCNGRTAIAPDCMASDTYYTRLLAVIAPIGPIRCDSSYTCDAWGLFRFSRIAHKSRARCRNGRIPRGRVVTHTRLSKNGRHVKRPAMKQLLLVVCGIVIGLFASPRLPKMEPTSAVGAFVKQWTQPSTPSTPVPEGGMIDPVTGRFVLYRDAHRNGQIAEPRTGGLPAPAPEPSSESAIRGQWGWPERGSLDQPARR